MMGSKSTADKTQQYLYFLSDPKAAQKVLAEHQAAVDAHNKARAEADTALKALDAKEVAIAKREQDVGQREAQATAALDTASAKQSVLTALENSLNRSKQEIQDKIEAANKTAAHVKEEALKEAASVREEALTLTHRLAQEIVDKHAALAEREKQAVAKEADLKKLANEVAARQVALQTAEKEHEAKVAALKAHLTGI